jgi:hypothetical protein
MGKNTSGSDHVMCHVTNLALRTNHKYCNKSIMFPFKQVLGSPVIYGIELDQFRSPIFKLRIQVTEENDKFLRFFSFIHHNKMSPFFSTQGIGA